MRIRRRDFLRTTAAGAAIALIGLSRKSSHAAEPSRARRVLIINAGGGLRSSAAFNASPDIALNPWGVLGQAGVLRLGAVLRADEAAVTTTAASWPGGGSVPWINQAATSFGLIAAADHAPDGSTRAGDHTDDEPRMGTGYFGKLDAPGLVTVLNRFIGPGASAPVATIGGAEFGTAPPAWVSDKPIQLAYDELPGQAPVGGTATVGRPLEAALDARYLARRRHLARAAVQSLVNTKATLRRFGPVLADKRLRFDSATYLGESLDGITNQMLLEAVGDAPEAGRPRDRGARNVALALRLLQLGSPAVSVSIGGFDTHDSEVQEAPQLYTRFARFIAGVHFALSRIPDPMMGGSMLDHTLVVTTSEFGRSGIAGGFNAAEGTDHGEGAGWRYQAHVVFGAGVRPNRLHPTDDTNRPLTKPASTHALLATIAAATGVPQEAIAAQWPSGTGLHPEGGPLWDLWA
ncbi:MAG: DUF1501 domain-containing protein [Deltaproteobacteria bacterium]|nr:DUF1501 domain-containing protein [Deltaproteobacteria bacterium]